MYAVVLQQNTDAYTKLFRLWNDTEYLQSFFTENSMDLAKYKLTVEEAVNLTIQEAELLMDKIIYHCETEQVNLDEVFRPLHNKAMIVELGKSKASIKNRSGWLRMYAVRLNSNLFVVTGGAIKLTHLMQDRTHTAEELKKLDKCRDFLKNNGIIDDASLFEFIL